MQVLIDVPDNYRSLCAESWGYGFAPPSWLLYELSKALVNGVVLPKGHGRLADCDKLEWEFEIFCCGECDCCSSKIIQTDGRGRYYYTCGRVVNAQTIIEADKGGD